MEKDTDIRTGWSHDRGCCTHSLFFYRIGGILRDRETEVGCLGIRVDGLRSDCLPFVGVLCGDVLNIFELKSFRSRLFTL